VTKLRSIWTQMKDLENGGWMPLAIGKWVLTVSWSNWQFGLGIEYSDDPGTMWSGRSQWVTVTIGRLGITLGKDTESEQSPTSQVLNAN